MIMWCYGGPFDQIMISTMLRHLLDVEISVYHHIISNHFRCNLKTSTESLNCYWCHHIKSGQTYFPCNAIKALRPSEAIWLQRSGSTLPELMACCLMAPSHHLNQCWLIMNLVVRNPLVGIRCQQTAGIHIYKWYLAAKYNTTLREL